jgi:RNA polymerase sigma factor (sigma-70 family)
MSVRRAVTDGDLWVQAAVDPSAFGELFERHADALYNHCFRRTASWSAAEDLVSVVFLEAWRRHGEVQLTGDSILPWLLAVGNNAMRNRTRSIRQHQRLLAKLPHEVTESDQADEVAARIDDERTMRAVVDVFSMLNENEQDVLSLCAWAGIDYTDAAAVLGVPVGTVRSRLSRARAHLRQLAEGSGTGDDIHGGNAVPLPSHSLQEG